MSCPHYSWCTRTYALLGGEGIHVIFVINAGTGLVLISETGWSWPLARTAASPAVGHVRRKLRLHDIPYFGQPVRLLWARRALHPTNHEEMQAT
ncbi:hypothetical protein [Pseudarthrobacter sp. BIM B-2242]|uniref:hypothetical protein n=1 Tax=Pseudarthrobacter sp. BIM B-2242 TaxID=2772401 RepID=UPI00168A89FA|nr:hypothetical protein [Pseudarthrobacter sp. BIM B-2242]QOD02628.1 hypothetical protein IDT60_14890 [Pseudarthrobacter sp. BIM B-2242]